MGIKDIPTSARSSSLPMGASLGCATPFPLSQSHFCSAQAWGCRRGRVCLWIPEVSQATCKPATLGQHSFLAMFFDVCSRVRLVNTCPGPQGMLLLQFRAGREGGTNGGGHCGGSVWAGDVACAEQSHSCQAHPSLPVDREQPWTVCGWRRWVNRPVQAGAGQPELRPRSVRAVGSVGSAGWLRLVEEQSSGWVSPAGCCGHRVCSQEDAPSHFALHISG